MGRLPWWGLPRGTGTAAATMGGPSGFRPLGSASPGESSPGDYMVFLWFSLGNRQGQSITVVHSHCLGCVKENQILVVCLIMCVVRPEKTVSRKVGFMRMVVRDMEARVRALKRNSPK